MRSQMHKATADFAPFSFYIEAADITDHTCGPRYIHVRVDQAFMDKLARRHAFCEAEGLAECREDCSPSGWGNEPHSPDGMDRPAVINYWQLFVDKDEFAFIGKDYEVITESRMVCSADLGLWLRGTPADSQSDVDVESVGFRRIGGILLYTEDDMDAFVDMLTRCCPKVAAARVEVEMVKRIATNLEADKSSAHITADQGLRARPRNTRI